MASNILYEPVFPLKVMALQKMGLCKKIPLLQIVCLRAHEVRFRPNSSCQDMEEGGHMVFHWNPEKQTFSFDLERNLN